MTVIRALKINYFVVLHYIDLEFCMEIVFSHYNLYQSSFLGSLINSICNWLTGLLSHRIRFYESIDLLDLVFC